MEEPMTESVKAHEEVKETEVLTKEPQVIRSSVYASQTGQSFTTHMPTDKGKGIAKDSNVSPIKLMKASREIRQDPDAAPLIDYHMPDSKMFIMTYDEVDKVHIEKVKKNAERKKKIYDKYVWTTTKRRNEGKTIEIHIHARTKLVDVTVYRNNDIMNFELHKEFKFCDFGISEWDELGPRGGDSGWVRVGGFRLKEAAESLNIDNSIPLPLQDPSKPKQRKRKTIELEHETFIDDLHYNRIVPQGVKFRENIALEEPGFGLLFIDEFGDPTFQKRFVKLIDKMIQQRPDKHVILSKKANLEVMVLRTSKCMHEENQGSWENCSATVEDLFNQVIYWASCESVWAWVEGWLVVDGLPVTGSYQYPPVGERTRPRVR
nr:hypothetical protein [Tanacetum cinerariifolium]